MNFHIEKHITIFMEIRTSTKGRGIWSAEENRYLIKLANERQKMSWHDIALEINKQYAADKTGKQCRERFRNYADPTLKKTEWKVQEKLLFLILHKFYGNQWSNIAKLMHQRNDIVVKNYSYSVIRKALKQYKTGNIPTSLLKKPSKFYQVYMVLENIKEHYLPVVQDIQSLPKYSFKEKIILNLLKERGVTKNSITKYEEQLIKKIKETYKATELPKEIIVNLDEFNFSPSKAEELISSENLYNLAPLSELVKLQVRIKLSSRTEKLPLLPPLPPMIQRQPGYYVPLNHMSTQFSYMTNQCVFQMQSSQYSTPSLQQFAYAMSSVRNGAITALPSVQQFQFYPTINTPRTTTYLPSFQHILPIVPAHIAQMKDTGPLASLSPLTALLGVVDEEQLEPARKIKK